MSPASSGAFEVERYIGACLISSQQSRHKKHYVHQDIAYNTPRGDSNFRLPRNNGDERWAGGVPLITFTTHQRCWNNNPNSSSTLSRLAVRTQGVPLILSNSKYRKNKARNIKTDNKPDVCTDSVSVASDESSSSANSENCLPRIIKPRKRRKKDRKPPHLLRPLSQDSSFSNDSLSPDITLPSNLAINQFTPYNFESIQNDNDNFVGDISEAPKLHHSFEDIEEAEGPDLNGNFDSLCQCRYCDPSGQIWDIDRSCFSPYLTSPSLHYSTKFKNQQEKQDNLFINLIKDLSTCSLDEESKSASSSPRDLEVSTEIVTSHNGHRDLEIKFISSG